MRNQKDIFHYHYKYLQEIEKKFNNITIKAIKSKPKLTINPLWEEEGSYVLWERPSITALLLGLFIGELRGILLASRLNFSQVSLIRVVLTGGNYIGSEPGPFSATLRLFLSPETPNSFPFLPSAPHLPHGRNPPLGVSTSKSRTCTCNFWIFVLSLSFSLALSLSILSCFLSRSLSITCRISLRFSFLSVSSWTLHRLTLPYVFFDSGSLYLLKEFPFYSVCFVSNSIFVPLWFHKPLCIAYDHRSCNGI